MNNTEARQILIDHNAWRRGGRDKLQAMPKQLGLAIDTAIASLGKESPHIHATGCRGA